jgi:hypothetical protein
MSIVRMNYEFCRESSLVELLLDTDRDDVVPGAWVPTECCSVGRKELSCNVGCCCEAACGTDVGCCGADATL